MRFGFGTRRRPGRAQTGLGAESLTLPASPAWPLSGLLPMAAFGQESADRLATDSPDATRRLTLPADALTRPSALEDWYCVVHARTGNQLRTANYEVLASNGASVVSNGPGAGIAIYERGTASPAGMNWRWHVAINNPNSRDLLGGMVPAATSQPLVELGSFYAVVFGVVGNLPYLGIHRQGAAQPHFRAVGQDIRQFNQFYFPVAQYTNATVERAGNVLTLRRASMATTYQPGTVVLIQSVSQPAINGIYAVATRLGSNAGFTLASNGADFAQTPADASVAVVRNSFTLFDTIGGLKTPIVADNYGWGGSAGPIELRRGTMPISGGLIDAGWLSNVAHRRIGNAAMPGIKHYRNLLNPENGYAADSDGIVTGPATAIGTPARAPHGGADWLIIEPWDWHTPFASDLDPAGGSVTGTVRLRFTSPFRTGKLLARVEDAAGNVILAERRVSAGSKADGTGRIELPGVPNGSGRYLRIRAARGGFEMRWGPFSVGPSFAWLSQSTINVLFQSTSGTSLAPLPASIGHATVGDVAGPVSSPLTDAAPNPTNGPGFCRLGRTQVAVAGSTGDGIAAFTAKLVELQNARTGAPMAAAAYALCRSGHPADIFWADRRSFTNAIGTAAPGVMLSGTWKPHPQWITTTTYAESGTPVLWRGGSLAPVDPADPASPLVLTGATQAATLDGTGNWVGAGVSGTFNIDTGIFSITDAAGGPLFVSARMQFDTPSASTSGGRQPADGFTVWGSDSLADSGHISNLLRAMPRQTAFVWSWANYLLGWASGRTQAEVNAKVAFDIAMVRRRIEENYPEHAGTPWIIACDARTKSTSGIGEHRIRKAMRNYALQTANTHWSIGPITADMDAVANSPHPGPLASSGQLWGITFAHGMARTLGMAGARADEVHIVSGTRGPGGTYVDLVFNVPAGASLACADPTKIEGLYFGTTDDEAAMALVDVAGGTHTTAILSANTVRVTRASGTFPAVTWWNCHVGFVLTDAVFATENARLANTLALNNGGYNGIRPGQPVSFCPVNVRVE
ncbi:MAG: hypothetical protein RIQ46_1842 [Pseudomonadota bacterium]